jgi:hypothetical protein
MPPSGYFQTGQDIGANREIGEQSEEMLYLAESESLLEFAEENSIRQTHLEFHYRSRHPFLIDFSNAAFYGNKLVPMPDQLHYKPIHFIDAKGIYSEGENPIEADRVVEILAKEIKPLENGEIPTVGVATTNIYQRNLIWEKITERCFTDEKFAKKFASLNANRFFVKNLENIQGDERDILIISTTFGPDKDGNTIQSYGPLNQTNGYRLLNVIITRAKYQVFVCSSISPALFSNYKDLIAKNGNNGRGIFYAYLAYAYAIEQNNETERKNILDFLSANCKEANAFKYKYNMVGPFETFLKKFFSTHFEEERIKSPYQLGGFWIDTFILSDNNEIKSLAVECNAGYVENDDESYIQLLYRQKLLESFGIRYWPVLSLKFWNNYQHELKTIMQHLGLN